MGNLLQPWHVILLLLVPAMIAIAIVPLWMIAKRAGLPPAISLLTVIPFLGLIVMYYIAFAEWPNVPAQG